MILDLRKKASASLTLVLLGNEEWLKGIYARFRSSSSVLSGRIKVVPRAAGTVAIEGELSYTPQVVCSRCGDEIAWPLQINFKVCYSRRGRNEFPRSLTLRRNDLDAYYYDDGCIDLAELVNEQVQLALPDNTVPVAKDGCSCGYCQADLRDPLVYGEGGVQVLTH